MRLANAAWDEVDTKTIQHCWRKSGILPDMDTSTNDAVPSSHINAPSPTPIASDPIVNAEKEVENVLDELTDKGALHNRNRMTIEDLLNPEEEGLAAIMESTEEEIFDAVMKSHAAQEESDVNGGDDDVDDNAVVVAGPTRQEALDAAAKIEAYLRDTNDPTARKVEALLVSFRRQLRLEESRSKAPTLITSYFTRA